MEYTLKFKQEYNRLFKINPLSANVLLLFVELYDDAGKAEAITQEDLRQLMLIKFNNVKEYQLPKENME